MCRDLSARGMRGAIIEHPIRSYEITRAALIAEWYNAFSLTNVDAGHGCCSMQRDIVWDSGCKLSRTHNNVTSHPRLVTTEMHCMMLSVSF